MHDHGGADRTSEAGGSGTLAGTPTLVRLVGTLGRVPEGEPVRLAATVQTVHGDGPAPTGSVTFQAGPRVLGAACLDAGGSAVLPDVLLPSGLYAVVATYHGDRAHAPATSAPVPQAVVAEAVSVLVAVAEPVSTSAGVVLEAEILDAGSGRLREEASGSLLFVVDGVAVGSAPLRCGQAQIVIPSPRMSSVVVKYHGDADHAAASGSYDGSPVTDRAAADREETAR